MKYRNITVKYNSKIVDVFPFKYDLWGLGDPRREALNGGHQCRMSSLRNGNFSCRYFCKTKSLRQFNVEFEEPCMSCH